eukprot:GHVQ01001615.1.p1 GENE.GHVQ01001615.1~~GHVQ01001615.1.p1  ORF type:complete len:563 (+),score=119.20 GHVQ01001615.1:416-2104(+)
MAGCHLPYDHICSSPFAVVKYDVHPDFGGDAALARFRHRLALRGVRLLVDFVPNHVATDHEWLQNRQHTLDYIMPGNDEQLRQECNNYKKTSQGCIVAHGKDPHFDGWTDTAQLNYFNHKLRESQTSILKKICLQADAVRCDMAMLVCSDILMNTWGERYKHATGNHPHKPPEFWSEAIRCVKAINPEFLFMAEVYWSMEGHLMQQGFDYCYDKGLYDELHRHDYGAVKHALHSSSLQHQQGLVRFLENHDEERAAKAFPDLKVHRAAAALAYLSPGLKFFHQGQVDGLKERLQMQRQKPARESPTGEVRDLYLRLMDILKLPAFRTGYYYTLDILPSSPDSHSHHSLISFLYTPSSPLLSPPIINHTSSSPSSSPPPIYRYGNSLEDRLNPIMVVVNYSSKDHANGFIKLHCSSGTHPIRWHTCNTTPTLSAGCSPSTQSVVVGVVPHSPPPPPPPHNCFDAVVRRLAGTALTVGREALLHGDATEKNAVGGGGGGGGVDEREYVERVHKEIGNGQGKMLLLRDVYGSVEAYSRELCEFRHKGIWFNVEPMGVHVFEIQLM